MNRTFVALAVVAAVVLIAFSDPALAGPGGKIAKAAFETFWGRVILALLVIFFLPLIILMMIKEKRAERRARRDLTFLAGVDPRFQWLRLRERAQACFQRVHSAWDREDVSEAAAYMTDWYWQNQQLAFLDRWAAEGLVNHCEVKSISRIRPLLVQHESRGADHEGSKVVLQITANMQDYLAKRDSDEIVEGSRKYKDVETLWTFELVDGDWKVSNIDESAAIDDYLQIAKDLPPIEEAIQSTGVHRA